MGRNYVTSSGQDGKFCFGSQPSDSPENFGMAENTSVISYYVEAEDFDYEYLNDLIDEVFDKELDSKKLSANELEKLKESMTENKEVWEKKGACDLYLGLTIAIDCATDGWCNLEAEL